MHPLMLQKIVESCRERIAQGDCPTTSPIPREQLESAIDELATECARLRQDAELDAWLALPRHGSQRMTTTNIHNILRRLIDATEAFAAEDQDAGCGDIDDAIREAKAYLAARQPLTPPTPPGITDRKVCPREPTRQMIEAGKAQPHNANRVWIWRAMYDAAPAIAEGKHED